MKYLNRPFIIGITFIVFSSWLFLPDFFTFRSSLKVIKGEIDVTRNSLDVVKSYNQGRIIQYETKSLLNTLSFKLKNHNQIFSIKKNLGEQLFTNTSETYEGLGQYLEKSDSVAIWIRKDETSEYEPKIFEMEVDGKTEIFFDNVRFAFLVPYFISLIVGLALMYVGVYLAEEELRKKD